MPSRSALSAALQLRIERREDAEPLTGEGFGGIARGELAPHEVDEVRRVVALADGGTQRDRLGARAFLRLGGERPLLVHRRQHQVTARACPLRVAEGRVRVRRADEAGEQRSVADRQVVELLAEVELRRLADPEDALAPLCPR